MTSTTDDRQRLQRAMQAIKTLQAKVALLERGQNTPIAIIGTGCRFPGGIDSPSTLWSHLQNKTDAITTVPPERWDADGYYDPDPATPGKIVTRHGGFIPDIDLFDPEFFGISPREAASMDPQHRLLLEVIWETLEDANLPIDQLAGSATGVFVGISSSDYAQLLTAQDPTSFDAYMGSGNAHSVAVGRISFLLGLKGPCLAIDTACSSSATAIHLACQSLRHGECNLALAGGVNLLLSPTISINHSRARMLAADGRCKSFSAAADGFSRADGCGIVAMKRLETAQANHDTILAVISGSAINHDGKTSGLTVPNGLAQQDVIRQALENAQVHPHQVAFVEAHGTGTTLGDPIEAEALGAVFRTPGPNGESRQHPLVVGAIKGNFGHAEAAAGVAGVIKTALAIHHQQIPPNLHGEKLNPLIPWEHLPLEIPTATRPWPPGPHIAGVSSFGFGGTNVHFILGEPPASSPPTKSDPPQALLLALSAKSEEGLHLLADRYRHFLDHHPEITLEELCHVNNIGRAHWRWRLALQTTTRDELRHQLAEFAAGTLPTGTLMGKIPLDDLPDGTDAHLLDLPTLATRYIQGAAIHWAAITPKVTGNKKIRLPGHPWHRRRFWSPTIAPATPPPPLAHIVWEEAKPQEQPEKPIPGRWLLLGSGNVAEDHLTRQLENLGAKVQRLIPPENFDPEQESAWSPLLVDHPHDPPLRGIIHALGLNTSPAMPADPLCGIGSIPPVLRAISQSKTQPRLWFLTRAAAALSRPPGETATPAWSLIPGIGKVIALEYPQWWGGMIDLPNGQTLPDSLAWDLFTTGEDHIAWSDGKRLVPRLKPMEPPITPSNSVIAANATYLITGGMGTLGNHVVRLLADHGAESIALLGRRPQEAETTQKLYKHYPNLKIRYFQTDVADPDALSRTLAVIRKECPPLKGIFHLAGLPGFDLLPELTPERMKEVLRPKVFGGWNLHHLTQNDPLTCFVCFSSIASVWGSKGQGHYGAANHFLDTLVHYRRSLRLPALSINWGPWAEGGMADANTLKTLAQRGVHPLTPQQGIKALHLALQTDATQWTVAKVAWPRFLEVFTSAGQRPLLKECAPGNAPHPPESDQPDDPHGATPVWTQQQLITFLREETARILERDANHLPDLRDGFFEMGMDSLLAVELKNSCEKQLKIKLSSTLIFDHPTIQQLSDHIIRLLQPRESAAPPQPNHSFSAVTSPDAIDAAIARELVELEKMLED